MRLKLLKNLFIILVFCMCLSYLYNWNANLVYLTRDETVPDDIGLEIIIPPIDSVYQDDQSDSGILDDAEQGKNLPESETDFQEKVSYNKTSSLVRLRDSVQDFKSVVYQEIENFPRTFKAIPKITTPYQNKVTVNIGRKQSRAMPKNVPAMSKNVPVKTFKWNNTNVRIHCDKTMTTDGDQWHPVSKKNITFVYSAYFEPEVTLLKIFGIQPTKQKEINFVCWITVRNKKRDIFKISGKSLLMRDHHSCSYGAMVISCQVPINTEPISVGVSETIKNTPLKYIVVHHPGTKLLRNFTVCLSVLHSNYSHVADMLESLAFYKSLGAEHYIIHRQSSSLDVNIILNHHRESGLFTSLTFVVPVDDVHNFAQIVAINDCVYRSRGISRFVVVTDLDEIIISKQNGEWSAMMEMLTLEYPRAGSFLFRQVFYDMKLPDVTLNFPEYKYLKRLKSKRFFKIYRDQNIYPPGSRSKLIIMPERVRLVGIHRSDLIVLKNNFTNVDVDSDIAVMFHYKKSFIITKRIRDDSIRRFAQPVIHHLNTTVTALAKCIPWLGV